MGRPQDFEAELLQEQKTSTASFATGQASAESQSSQSSQSYQSYTKTTTGRKDCIVTQAISLSVVYVVV